MNKYYSVTIALTTSISILMVIAVAAIIHVSQTGQTLPLELWLTTGFYSASSITGFASTPLLLKGRRLGNVLSFSSAVFGLIGFSIIFTSTFLKTPGTRSEVLMLAVGGLSFIFLMIIIATSTIGLIKPKQNNSLRNGSVGK
ncbi:hypothetical protein KEJ27_06490 [Candidatus Bathyarchaeota archaeon]|nr:hypothetical protein [Candidatus Bathyarchaeota archaeon]MBS7613210.1 hypothetical protein [Candidatus Bathyarchaeota archaeon]MBS7617402.1 hypothetical protein [Candidatus Bathyarchaeota archaeon]